MSDKPTTPTPAKFLHAALAVLVGTMAIYLAMELLRSMLMLLAVASVLILAAWLVVAVRRARRPSDW